MFYIISMRSVFLTFFTTFTLAVNSDDGGN